MRNEVSICAGRANMFQRGNEFEENHRGGSCKVGKSNGIEIQINAALNDAYRISRPWKERKCERKDPDEPSKEVTRGDDKRSRRSILRRVVNQLSWDFLTDIDSIQLQFYLQ